MGGNPRPRSPSLRPPGWHTHAVTHHACRAAVPAHCSMHDDYSGQGVDQLAELIHKIKTNPSECAMLELVVWRQVPCSWRSFC